MDLTVTTTAQLPDDDILIAAGASVAPYSGTLGAPALNDAYGLLASPYPSATVANPKILVPAGNSVIAPSKYSLFSLDITLPATSGWTWAAGSPPADGVYVVLALPGFQAALIPGVATTVYFSRSYTPADYVTDQGAGNVTWTPVALP